MSKKKSYKEHLSKFKEVHGNKYLYPDDQEVGLAKFTWIDIYCKTHGWFKKRIDCHVRGQGCPTCSLDSTKKSRQYSTEDFILKATKVHGDKYLYDKVEYVESKTKVKIICKEHGVFYQIPASHLIGKGCGKCANEYSGKKRSKTKETFVEDAFSVHGGKYSYEIVQYTNSKEKVEIICPVHGVFKQSPNLHLRGNGCPSCFNDRKRWHLHPSQYDKPHITYLLEFTVLSTGQKFYKVGITMMEINERFCYSEYVENFRYEIVAIYESTGKRCEDFEKEILNYLKKKKEYRKVTYLKDFGADGWTECFKGGNLFKEIFEMFKERSLMYERPNTP